MIISFGERSRWFLAEFVVIIVGVLVALAIDEWRGTLQDTEREQEYLAQLAADLQATQDMFASVFEKSMEAQKSAKQLADIFENGSEVEVAEVRRLLTEMRYMNNPVPILGTAEALISTGDVRLIRDRNIRSELTGYLSRSRDFWLVPLYQVEEQHNNIYWKIILRAQFYRVTPAHIQGPAAQTGNPDLNGFLADPEAYTYVVRFANLKATIAGFCDAMSDEAASLAALLPLAE